MFAKCSPRGELEKGEQYKKIGIASSDRPVTFYSLDVIISASYRVTAHRGTQLRMWATRTLKERLIQGHRDRRRLEGKGIDDVRDALGLAQSALAAPELGSPRWHTWHHRTELRAGQGPPVPDADRGCALD